MGVTDDDKTQLGPVISPENKDRTYKFIDSAEPDGFNFSCRWKIIF